MRPNETPIQDFEAKVAQFHIEEGVFAPYKTQAPFVSYGPDFTPASQVALRTTNSRPVLVVLGSLDL